MRVRFRQVGDTMMENVYRYIMYIHFSVSAGALSALRRPSGVGRRRQRGGGADCRAESVYTYICAAHVYTRRGDFL